MVEINIVFQQRQLTLTLPQYHLSHHKTKKKILKKLGYYPSDHNKIRLNFFSIYQHQPTTIKTPIFNDQSFKAITDFLLKGKRPFQIYVEALEPLLPKEDRKIQKNQIQFDENGSQISNDQLQIITPTFPLKYSGNQVVRCAFCKKGNKNKKSLRECGGLFGPFRNNTYVHLLCAIWCSNIYLNQEGELVGVNEAINESIDSTCCYCKKKGAGLICHADKCRRSLHYECGRQEDKCYFDWQLYKIYCHKCKHKIDDQMDIE